MTAQQAQYLISLPKKIVENATLLDHKSILMKVPFQQRYELLSEEDQNYLFLVEVFQSGKNFLKIYFHYQEDNTKYGLLRVDYNARHKNPEIMNEHVPEICRPYCGQYLDTGHIHLMVEGYRPLAWAIPLTADTFPVKDIRSMIEIPDALSAFFNRINVQTHLNITVLMDAFL